MSLGTTGAGGGGLEKEGLLSFVMVFGKTIKMDLLRPVGRQNHYGSRGMYTPKLPNFLKRVEFYRRGDRTSVTDCKSDIIREESHFCNIRSL